jgi:drug/metabolite transporter (DMT)-like permease
MVITEARPSVAKAALWMSGTLLSFALMGVAGRELSGEFTTFQILFWRSLVGGLIVVALLGHQGWHHARTRRPVAQIARNLFHFAAAYGWFYGLGFISLAEVFALEFTTPIWTAILAVLFLKERITPLRAGAIALGFVGILLITRPGVQAIQPASLAVLGAALGYAISNVLVKSLSDTDSPLTIIFYMTVIQLPLGLGFSVADWVWPSAAAWPWLVVVGVTGLSAHYCMVRAFRHADASLVVPLDFLRLPLIAVLGFLAYGEAFDPWILGGAALVFCGTFLNLRFARRAIPPA